MSRLEVRVPARFTGPPTSGNGGWSAGALAELVGAQAAPVDGRGDPVVTVQLRRPPPLDTGLLVRTEAEWTLALDPDGETVLRARLGDPDPPPVPPVDAATARAAQATYPGLREHPFPTCFSCGTDREPGDGLRIFPGPVDPVEGAARVAATWVPAGDVGGPDADLATTWAAVDCVGAWALDSGARLLVLGQVTTRVYRRPRAGVEHVVVGLAGPVEGRRHHATTSLYDDRGLLAGTAQVWFAVGV